jgi:chromosome segregation ATPase
MESTISNPLSPLSERLAEVKLASNSINKAYEEIFHELEKENKKLSDQFQALKMKQWNMDCEVKRVQGKNEKLKEKKEKLGQKLEGMLDILPDFDENRNSLVTDSDAIEDAMGKMIDYDFDMDRDPRSTEYVV